MYVDEFINTGTINTKMNFKMEAERDNSSQMMWLWKLQICLLAVQARVKILVQKRAYFRRARPVGRKWTRLYNTEEKREQHSLYNSMLQEAAMADHYIFFNTTRIGIKKLISFNNMNHTHSCSKYLKLIKKIKLCP